MDFVKEDELAGKVLLINEEDWDRWRKGMAKWSEITPDETEEESQYEHRKQFGFAELKIRRQECLEGYKTSNPAVSFGEAHALLVKQEGSQKRKLSESLSGEARVAPILVPRINVQVPDLYSTIAEALATTAIVEQVAIELEFHYQWALQKDQSLSAPVPSMTLSAGAAVAISTPQGVEPDPYGTGGVLPQPFFAIAAPSGAGKTQLGFTLSRDSRFKVVHVALASFNGVCGEFAQPVYTSERIREPTRMVCAALEKDWPNFYGLIAEDMLSIEVGMRCRRSETVVLLAQMFGLLQEDAPKESINTVRQLRAAVARIRKERKPLPVMVVDEAYSLADDAKNERMYMLRDFLRATGIAAIFMGTSLDVGGMVISHAAGGSRVNPAREKREWVQFRCELPAAVLTTDEIKLFSVLCDELPPISFVRPLMDMVETAFASGSKINPLFVHNVCAALRWMKDEVMLTLDADDVLAAAADMLYRCKPHMRSIEGLRAQIQFHLSDPLTAESKVYVHRHFARFNKNVLVWLSEYGNSCVRHGRQWEPFTPVPYFPTFDEDPLLTVLMANGCCTGTPAAHPAPFAVQYSGRTYTLTAAAALLITYSRGSGSASTAASNHLALTREGAVLECIGAVARMSASRSSGLGGTLVGDFLLQFVAEVQAVAPKQKLRWAQGSDLADWFSDTNLRIPAVTRLSSAPFPFELTPSMGYMCRPINSEEVDNIIYAIDGTKVFVAEEKNRETVAGTDYGRQPVVGTWLSSVADKIATHKEATLGIALVSAAGDTTTGLGDEDTNVVKLELAEGAVSIKPLGASRTTAVKPRLQVVVECDEERLLEALQHGELSAVYQHFTSAHESDTGYKGYGAGRKGT